jgi:hypothetical protein
MLMPLCVSETHSTTVCQINDKWLKARLYLLTAKTNISGLLRCDTMQFGKEEPAMPCHAMKAHRKNTGTAPLISDPGTRGSWEGNLMPQQVYPRKEPWYPLKRRLREHSGGKNNLLPCQDSNPRFSSPQLNQYTDYTMLAPPWSGR